MSSNTARSNSLLAPFRRGRPSGGPRHLPDPRPATPLQLALIGGGVALAGLLVPALGFLTLVGIILVLVAGLTSFIRPRARQRYWRGRPVDLGDEPARGERLYRAIYRR